MLREKLTTYAARKYSRDDTLRCLQDELGYSIKKCTLDKLQTRLKIHTVRKPPPIEVSRQAVIDEVAKDPLQLNGPIMHDHFDAGFTLRFPGHKKECIPHVGLSALGPFHKVSADSHEKLSAQALQMGELSLPIYAYKDKWTDLLLMLRLIPNSQTAAAIGHLFLDFVDETGCIPLQVTTDKGSEIGWQYTFQCALCEALAPGIDPLVYAVYMVLNSVHNTVIEGFWCWLRSKMGLNLKGFITRGKQDCVFDSNVAFHEQLDEFGAWWNNHRVRLQHNKNMLSGHILVLAFEHPDHLGRIDCRIHVPKEAVIELCELLTEEVGSRKSHLSWPGVTLEFATMAQAIWEDIGSTAMSVDSAWDVFAQMSDVIENHD
ncbi:hypothetical protein B0H14DRAFT_3114586 [Mycena olivaceomarginata]|nr:hypothetical protein B0H14DRAFT_3114586 [Mycena olivaceomarginata]